MLFFYWLLVAAVFLQCVGMSLQSVGISCSLLVNPFQIPASAIPPSGARGLSGARWQKKSSPYFYTSRAFNIFL